MHSSLSRLTVVLAVGGLVFLLSGCADQEARSNALDAKKNADSLQGEVAKLQQEVTTLKEQVAGMRGALEEKINEKMASIATSVTGTERTLREEFIAQMTKNGEEYKSIAGDMSSRVDSRLKSHISEDLAEHFNKMRAEIEKNRTELLGYMDQQLKELYPYAYQPKRLENPGPPTTPQ